MMIIEITIHYDEKIKCKCKDFAGDDDEHNDYILKDKKDKVILVNNTTV